MNHLHYDYVIIGAGIGAGSFLTEIVRTGASILVVERGNYITSEKENWDAKEMFVKKRYTCNDVFIDKDGNPFTPRMYYNVGGNSKVFGGSAFRFREADFTGGDSPSWPFTYKEISPFYTKAENLMHVCGKKGEDITEPSRDEYPYVEREQEPYIRKLSEKLRQQGLHPFHVPIAINGDICRNGSACDGYPCRIKAKHDAEVSFISPIVKQYSNVQLWTDSCVERLESKKSGKGFRIVSIIIKKNNSVIKITGDTVILAAGAINSALLLLKSKTAEQPHGLANSSDQVGRNYMTHINSVIMAVNPFRKNPTSFQKTLAIPDYYFRKSKNGSRLGSIQTRGKIKPENLQFHRNFFIRLCKKFISSRSVDFWVMTEDYPDSENRVFYDSNGKVHLIKHYTNIEPHKELIHIFSNVLRKIGYLWIHADLRTVHSVQHQCGTIRCGHDRKKFPLDKWCRSFDVSNLYVVDASIFPSSAALNPALTVAANALRVGEHLRNRYTNKK